MTRPHRIALARLLLISALTVPAGAVSAQTSSKETLALPDTAAGHLMSDWIAQCREPDLARMTVWIGQHLSSGGAGRMSAEARAADMFETCSANGGLASVAVASSEPLSITLRMQGRKTGAWFEGVLIANAEGQLDRGGLRPALPEESSLPARLDDAAMAREVKQTVARLTDAGLFSGIVTVARGDTVIARASGGFANRAENTPITGSSRFTLGSMGKMFTAVAIGQLADRNKLTLDDTVGKFFPDYPNKTVRDKVSVAMLLSHTSGMGDFLDKRTPAMMKHGVHRAAEFMPLYANDEPAFAPGSGREYSNAGFALAGAIVEKVSGESYPDYLRKHIFEPAGMLHSSANNIPLADPALVTPYTKEGSPDWKIAEADIGSPAGGAISSADDLVRFAEALRSGRLVSKAWLKDMATPHGPAGDGWGYGYAMGIADIYGETAVGHDGGFPGVSTHLLLVQGSPYTVVVLANQDPPAEVYATMPAVALVAERVKRERK